MPPVADITKGSKGAVFNVTDALFISPLFCVLMLSVAGGDGPAIGGSMGVEDPDVEKGSLNAHLYCVYALVGGAISIRDTYICAVSRVCANESHAVFHGPLSVQLKRSYRIHASIKAYFVGKKALGRRSCSR